MRFYYLCTPVTMPTLRHLHPAATLVYVCCAFQIILASTTPTAQFSFTNNSTENKSKENADKERGVILDITANTSDGNTSDTMPDTNTTDGNRTSQDTYPEQFSSDDLLPSNNISTHDVHLKAAASAVLSNIKSNLHGDVKQLGDLIKAVQKPKSREKRFILLPHNFNSQFKFQIDVPFKSFTRWYTGWQFDCLMEMFYPAEFQQEQDELFMSDIINPTLAELLIPKPEDEEEVLSRHRREAREQREKVYALVEQLIKISGLPSRPCLLRIICDVAEAPFEQELLGELLNTVFRPSSGALGSTGTEYDHFLMAESHGRHNGSCHQQYSECPESPFSRLPFVQHMFSYK